MPVAVSALVLILAVNMLDMLPNATLIPFTWLIAGAILGYAEDMRRTTLSVRDAQLRRAHQSVVLGREGQMPSSRRRTLL